jgi:hypothetical protein
MIAKGRSLNLALVAAAALRLALFYLTSLPAVFERRPELTSPLTSYRSRESTVDMAEAST